MVPSSSSSSVIYFFETIKTKHIALTELNAFYLCEESEDQRCLVCVHVFPKENNIRDSWPGGSAPDIFMKLRAPVFAYLVPFLWTEYIKKKISFSLNGIALSNEKTK